MESVFCIASRFMSVLCCKIVLFNALALNGKAFCGRLNFGKALGPRRNIFLALSSKIVPWTSA